MVQLHESLVLAIDRFVSDESSSSDHILGHAYAERISKVMRPKKELDTVADEEKDVLRFALCGFSNGPFSKRPGSFIV